MSGLWLKMWRRSIRLSYMLLAKLNLAALLSYGWPLTNNLRLIGPALLAGNSCSRND